MSRVSPERLDELIAQHEKLGLTEWVSVGRELKSYRKAVWEYLEAVDALKEYSGSQYAKSFDEGVSRMRAHEQAEANLRALERGETT